MLACAYCPRGGGVQNNTLVLNETPDLKQLFNGYFAASMFVTSLTEHFWSHVRSDRYIIAIVVASKQPFCHLSVTLLFMYINFYMIAIMFAGNKRIDLI